MKAHPMACLLLIGLAATAAAEPTLKDARERWLKGNYAEAQELYEDLAKVKEPGNQAAAVIGLSLALESQGEYEKALDLVEKAVKDLAKEVPLLAHRAEMLRFRGRWDDADKAAEVALSCEKDNFLARWVKTQIARDRGDLKTADAGCRWFVRTYSERSDKEMDIKDPDELITVGLAGAENARWNNLSDQFQFILNEVYADAIKYDKLYWPAQYQSGVLLLEKYNRPEAVDALDRALIINPSAAPALAAKGVSALQRYEIKDAESLAERALKINPSLPEALRLRADVYLATGDPASAMKELRRARAVSPRDERTLARIAACLHLQRKKDDLAALVQEVEKFDSKPALFWFDMGERLEERRHFAEAERCFTKAAELRPTMPGPANSLGMLYMRLGKEKEARPLLDRGFKADPFNVRVSNTKKVLDHLAKYETLKTEHFELRFDPKKDGPLARYMGEYLEHVYTELARKFQFKATGPILIEVFNNHDMFSGRTVGLPDLHTIGACTGRMVAMVSPRGTGIRKPFNWGRVMRHELVHIFNLEQTNFLIPHWYTEGLAVVNEEMPRPQLWNQLLRERVPSGELLNLDTVDLGFIRPRNPLEWQMAYCQSRLYVEYIQEKHGAAAIGGLLAAFADGLDSGAAIKKVCGVDKAAFEKGYRAYLDEIVKQMHGKPAEKKKSFKQLQEEVEKDQDNLEASAALAEMYMGRGNRAEARRLAERVLQRDKKNPQASAVLARLARLSGNPKEERAYLEAALNKSSPDPKILLALGKIAYDAGEFPQAAELFELGHKTEPLEASWLEQLARVHAQTGDKAKQIAVLKELVPTDADDLDQRKRLVRLLLEKDQYADAERFARQAMEIDPQSDEVQEMLFKAMKGQKKDAEVERLQKLLKGA
jgi:tetratricopeptide (TPR) repeat protein